MRARPHQRTEIEADAERIVVEPQRNAAAIVKLKVEIIDWLKVDACFIAIVPNEGGATSRDTGTSESVAVRRCAAGTALCCRAAAEDPADHRLVSPRRDIVSACRKAEGSLVVFQAASERCVVAERREGAREISRVH